MTENADGVILTGPAFQRVMNIQFWKNQWLLEVIT